MNINCIVAEFANKIIRTLPYLFFFIPVSDSVDTVQNPSLESRAPFLYNLIRKNKINKLNSLDIYEYIWQKEYFN